ncbi:ATP-binding protein [Haloarcula laminariae]|uniref:ATP-binding protein n=1 Tax=Haloarcula laminariae TaxID=2961577 RepID=UPI0024069242|nr:ATP-binding protein [Halomicroarcula sp. FL173]
MFFLDEDFRFTRIAGSLADWLDRDPETLVGEPVTTIVAPSDVGALRTALARVAESQTSQTIASHFVVSGDRLPVDIELSPVASEASLGTIVGTVFRETVAGDRPPSQLVQLRNFIELLDDAAVVYELSDGDPVVRSVNAAFEETFGFQARYVVGQSLNDYIVPAAHTEEATRFDERVDEGNVTTELVRRKTANGVQQFAYRGLPIEHEDGRRYGLAIYADMTENQQARQHLQVLHRVLRHNVRNELTVIFGMAERILDDGASEEIREAAARILDSAEGLASVSEKARMAEDILGDPPSDTIVEVGSAATDVVADARARWPEASIETDIETPLPVSTGLEIRDALENLVENAITHNTGAPTVRVTARAETPIHASTRETGQNITITVEDDGPGIPDHEQAVIFEGANITQLKHGSGLGLWVVRWIVESADGAVSYSREDGWTTITLRLPLATGLDDAQGSEQANTDSL